MALLGAILHDNRSHDAVSGFLLGSHFASRVHGAIYQAIETLLDRGQHVDAITLRQFFEANRDLDEIGGYQYLLRLQGSVASIINAADYGRAIHDLHVRRELIARARELEDAAYNLDGDLDLDGRAIALKFETDLGVLGASVVREGEGLRPLADGVERWRAQVGRAARFVHGQVLGVPSGIRALDALLGGFLNGKLYVVAGRPSMGKSAFVGTVSHKAITTARFDAPEQTHAVGFFSVEMGAEELVGRFAADATGIAANRQFQPGLTTADLDGLMAWGDGVVKLPLYIDDSPAVSLSLIRSRARQLKRAGTLHLLVVDYLQIMDQSDLKSDGLPGRIGEITGGLKKLARELDIPIIVLSQLSRALEAREDKRPQLQDLRESGSIEQDADVVIFVYREDYYLQRSEPRQNSKESADQHNKRWGDWKTASEVAAGKLELIVGKNRGGPIGTVHAAFEGARSRVVDLEDRQGSAAYRHRQTGFFDGETRQGPPVEAYEDIGR